ncbi:MAG: hypothetical protein IJL94_01375, partial [Erysipelotrichaceae bacterium]|nr:hypothetical protein [Erysipelotrichaceae bacterium]
MSKKILFIVDKGTPTTVEDLSQQKYFEKYYEPLKQQYGYEVQFVEEDSLIIDGDTTAGTLKVEKEGPEWVQTSEATLKAAEDAEIICVSFGAVNKRLVDAAKCLKHVVVLRSGVENVNLQYCREKGIDVTNAPGRVSDPVADMTVAMMLAALREIQKLDLHNHDWNWCR